MNDAEHYLSVQNELGETPIWVPEEKSLYWVDFIHNTIFGPGGKIALLG